MQHICDEKGCRIVSDEEFEKIMNENSEKNEEKSKKNNKKSCNKS